MSVSAINGEMSKSLSATASFDQSAKGGVSAVDQTSNQLQEPAPADSVVNNGKTKQNLNTGIDSHKKPLRTMSHVVEVYNLQGKVRIKFMDSKNNVVYQIPTEMVAKMEDQMLKPETSTNTKG